MYGRIFITEQTTPHGWRRLPFFLLPGLLGLVFIVAGCNRSEKNDTAASAEIDGDKIAFATNAPQLGYLTVEPAQERHTVAVGLSGRLTWDEDLTVRVFSPVAGRVSAVQGEINLPVKKGDVLTSLNSPDYGQAQSDKEKAASDLALADRNLSRQRELFASDAAAKKDLESAEADYAKAKAEYERANAQLQALSYGHINKATGTYDLCSPVDGVIVEKNISPGQQIRSDQMLANAPQFINPLFTITDPARLWLYLDATETDVAMLNSNQEVTIHARAYPDKVFHGHIEVIGEGLDSTTRAVKVRCVADNSERHLRAEMYVNADVSASTVATVDVSTKAVFLKDNKRYVFVQTAPGRFQRRAVKLGGETNGRAVVVNGLAVGEHVVTEGCLLLEAMLEGENS